MVADVAKARRCSDGGRSIGAADVGEGATTGGQECLGLAGAIQVAGDGVVGAVEGTPVPLEGAKHRVLCGAPRRNRTGDPILTMNLALTAVRTSIPAGRWRP
jgi:hypothetical protein